MHKVRITFFGNAGTIYSEIDEFEPDEIELGQWEQPFPNVKGNSIAFGLEESIAQSEDCPPRLREEGIKRIRVSMADEVCDSGG